MTIGTTSEDTCSSGLLGVNSPVLSNDYLKLKKNERLYHTTQNCSTYIDIPFL